MSGLARSSRGGLETWTVRVCMWGEGGLNHLNRSRASIIEDNCGTVHPPGEKCIFIFLPATIIDNEITDVWNNHLVRSCQN